jgi:hypothetical protein
MQRNRFVILGILLATAFAAATDNKPALSKSPMTPDQIEVYRAFLRSYTNGSKSPHFNLAKYTSALELSGEEGKDGCLRGIDLDSGAHPELVIHEFDPNTSLRENITLVDTDEQGRVVKENDPSRTVERCGRALLSIRLSITPLPRDSSHFRRWPSINPIDTQ